jgi:type II secretory pathway pseudopilin PulG
MILVLAFAMPTWSAQSGKQENLTFTMVDASTMTAKVTDLDRQARTVQLTDDEGKARTVKVPDYVTNFKEMRIGDTVTMEVNQDISVEVQPGPGDTQNIATESHASAPPGQKPAGMLSTEGRLKTRIDAIDYDKRTVTFKNRKGVLTTYKFGKDAKRFDEIRRGDMLVIDYKGTVAISVK